LSVIVRRQRDTPFFAYCRVAGFHLDPFLRPAEDRCPPPFFHEGKVGFYLPFFFFSHLAVCLQPPAARPKAVVVPIFLLGEHGLFARFFAPLAAPKLVDEFRTFFFQPRLPRDDSGRSLRLSPRFTPSPPPPSAHHFPTMSDSFSLLSFDT